MGSTHYTMKFSQKNGFFDCHWQQFNTSQQQHHLQVCCRKCKPLHLTSWTEIESLTTDWEHQWFNSIHIWLFHSRGLDLDFQVWNGINNQISLVAYTSQAVVNHSRIIILASHIDQANLAYSWAINGCELLLVACLQMGQTEHFELFFRANH